MTGGRGCASLGRLTTTGPRIQPTSLTCAALALALAAGCTLSGDGGPVPPRPRVRSIVVTPASATVEAGTSLALHATVLGDGAEVLQGVTWGILSTSPVVFPLSAGTLTDAGVYAAPDLGKEDDDLRVVVSAASVVDASVTATATLVVPRRSVAVAPSEVTATLGDTVQFVATVHGVPAAQVRWASRAGTIDPSGLYRAPSMPFDVADEVVAEVSRRDVTSFTARASVHLRLRPIVAAGSPGRARAGDPVVLPASGLDQLVSGSSVEAVFLDAAGQELAVPGSLGAAVDRVTATVPRGAISGDLRLRVTVPGFSPVDSNAVAFERVPALRVHPERAVVAAGESTRLRVAFLGALQSFPLTFETDLGAIQGDVYTAPPSTPGRAHANVKACIAGTSSCAGVTIGVLPFRVEPSPALVPAGGALDLVATSAGAPVAATFSLASGGGTVTPAGRYTAPSAPADAGNAWLVAAVGGAALPVQVGVTGAVPGLLNLVEEDVDPQPSALRAGIPWGTLVSDVAVVGGRAHVAGQPATGEAYRWIDVYDLADPVRPAWLGAVESTISAPLRLAPSQGRLYASGAAGAGRPGWAVEAFDLATGAPVLVARSSAPFAGFFPSLPAPPFVDGDVLYEIADLDRFGGSFTVRTRRLVDGPLPPPRDVRVALGQDLEAVFPAAVAAGGRAYALVRDGLQAWDLTSSPPALAGTVPFTVICCDGLAVDGVLLRRGDRCWDRRPPVPVEVPCGLGDGVRRGVLGTDAFTSPGAISGGLFYTALGGTALAVLDVATPGGPRAGLAAPHPMSFDAFPPSAIRDGFLYAGALGQTSLLTTWSLATAPPTLVAQTAAPATIAALAAAGGALLAATPAGLDVDSLANPAAPARIATLPLAASALAVDGAIAWVGTAEGAHAALDVSAPAAPLELGRVALGAPVRGVAVLSPGRLAVALATADGTAGDLAVVDGAQPAAPFVAGTAGLAAAAMSVAVLGATVLVTTPTDLLTLDAADAAHVAVLATVPLPKSVAAPDTLVTASGNLAWVGVRSGAFLFALDVREPRWPRVVSQGVPANVLDGARGYLLLPFSVAEVDLSSPRNVVLVRGPAPASPPGVTVP